MIDREIVSADKCVLEIDLSRVSDKDVKIIEKAFDDCNKNAVFYCEDSSYATRCALKYALSEKNKSEKIIYSRFDRGAYLYTDSMKRQSVDCVLKECLSRPFVLEDAEKGECDPENYLLRFENAADENTLVIIDGFDLASASPYMRHVFASSCRVLVLCRKKNEGFSDNAVLVCAEKTIAEYDFGLLNERQSELLRTLCAIFEHLDSSIPVVSSKSGVFDETSVRFYLGSLADELPALILSCFVEVLPSGRIYIDESLRKQVIEKMKPNAENCRTFMKFVAEMCDFHLLQNVKDISALVCTVEGESPLFASSSEFLCAYTYFVDSDKKSPVRLYNALVSYMLFHLSMQKGETYTEHLLLLNIPYYLSYMYNGLLRDDSLKEIYDSALYADECLPDYYTDKIKLMLDVIRLSLSFIRNVTVCKYQQFENVLFMLLDAQKYILDYVRRSNESLQNKAALLDDVIRLCSESFDYFSVVDRDGLYNYKRDNPKIRRVCYCCEKESDKMYGDSICMGESHLTLRLYKNYAEYLCSWLVLADAVPEKNMGRLLCQLHEEKCEERQNTLVSLNAHFFRIINGFENYSDIYFSHDEKSNIVNFEISDIPEKRLNDNLRFLSRGFDGGTKKGSERYTQCIMKEIQNGKNPVNTAHTLLSSRYPLSDESYSLLEKCGFAEKLCDSENVSNLSLQLLLECALCGYDMTEQSHGKRNFYEYLITVLSERVNKTEAFLERMYHAAASLYVREKHKLLLHNGKASGMKFCDVLYSEYCMNSAVNPKFCDDVIANALYRRINNEREKINKTLLLKAVETYRAENELTDCRELLSFLHILP